MSTFLRARTRHSPIPLPTYSSSQYVSRNIRKLHDCILPNIIKLYFYCERHNNFKCHKQYSSELCAMYRSVRSCSAEQFSFSKLAIFITYSVLQRNTSMYSEIRLQYSMCKEVRSVSGNISVFSIHLKLYVNLSIFHLDFRRFEVSFKAKNLLIKILTKAEDSTKYASVEEIPAFASLFWAVLWEGGFKMEGRKNKILGNLFRFTKWDSVQMKPQKSLLCSSIAKSHP